MGDAGSFWTDFPLSFLGWTLPILSHSKMSPSRGGFLKEDSMLNSQIWNKLHFPKNDHGLLAETHFYYQMYPHHTSRYSACSWAHWPSLLRNIGFFGTDSTLALATSTSVTGIVYLLEVGCAGAVSSCLWPLSRASTALSKLHPGSKRSIHSQHKYS